MKHLLVLFALTFCLAASGQRTIYSGSLNAGASDTSKYELGTTKDYFFGGVWSYNLDYRAFDDVDAILGLYYSNHHPDSTVKVLMFFDQNLDGVNDNPFTLSDTTNGGFFKWGYVFPGQYFIRVLTRGSVSDSTACYEKIIEQ